MPITVVCPECETTYQLQPDMVGKTMVCKNTVCRHSFVVQGPAPTVSNWWEAQPEVRSPGAEPRQPAPTTPAATSPPDPLPTPTPSPAPASTSPPVPEPPPVRKPATHTAPPRRTDTAGPKKTTATPTTPPASSPTSASTPGPTPAPAPAPKKAKPRPGTWASRIVVGLLLAVVAILGVAAYWAYSVYVLNEEKLARESLEMLKTGQHERAAEEFLALSKRFTRSTRHAEYESMEKLARTLATLDNSDMALDQAMLGLKQYLAASARDTLIEPYHTNLGKAVERRVVEFTDRVLPATDDSPVEHIEKARELVGRLARLQPPGLTANQVSTLNTRMDQVLASVDTWRKRKDLEDALTQLTKDPGSGADKLRAFDKLVRSREALFPGLGKEPKIQDLRNQLIRGQQESIVYRPGPGEAAPLPAPESPGNLWVQCQIQKAEGNNLQPGDDIVLALARGVLYALNRGDGKVVWARRVGIDTTSLPVRVRGDEANRDRILVLSADKATLTALDRDGQTIWEHALGDPCLGRPVIVEQRAFLATTRGVIQEVELTRGRLLGTFDLGQRITHGGVREKGTTRLYFAADEGRVYVLDVETGRRGCVAVLHTGHPNGALRAAPVLLPGEKPGEPGYLVLTLARGLVETGLGVYQLPDLEGEPVERKLTSIPASGRDFWMLGEGARCRLQRAWPEDTATTPRPDLRLPGWTWFPPAVDPEKMAFLTEEGRLGLIGIRQPQNQDPLLFPLLPLNVAGNGTASESRRERAQVVRMLGNDLWLLTQGKLRRERLVWDKRTGPKLAPSWSRHVDVGEPLHQAQALPDPRNPGAVVLEEGGNYGDPDSVVGRAVLYTVTQPVDRPSVLVTAIEDETGQVLWQTQLGLVAAAEPLRLKSAVGPEMLLVMDQAGALHRLPADLAQATPTTWQGFETLLAGNLADNPRWPPQLVPVEGNNAAVQVAAPGNGRSLVLRRVSWDAAKNEWVVESHTIPLSAPLAGSPGLVAGHLILPLGDGNLYRLAVPLVAAPVLQPGPSWRDRYLGPEAVGHVVSLGGDRFVTSDGQKGLTVWEWSAVNPTAVALPPNRPVVAGFEQPTFTLARPLAGRPLHLPAAGPKPEQLLVPDLAGTLLALVIKPDGKLERRHVWELGGTPRTGPYLATSPGTPARLGVVVDENRLAWIDPESDQLTLWKPAGPGETLVGRPRQQGDMVWITTETGRVLAIDPSTGMVSEKLLLSGSIAPATTPINTAEKAEQLLLPLSDGTLMLMAPK